MTDIDITTLTAAQLKQITIQLKAVKAESSGKRKEWQTLLDTMLDEKTHTTAAIWQAGFEAGHVDEDPSSTTGKDRDRVLKRIQARYQKRSKAGDDVGVVRTVVIGKPTMSLAAVIEWLGSEATDAEVSALREEIGA
tara:strand:- start:310 stop:720 length:411 start_codon:yes stop_codon:yes gene_type:complete